MADAALAVLDRRVAIELAREKLIVALDFSTIDDARAMVKRP